MVIEIKYLFSEVINVGNRIIIHKSSTTIINSQMICHWFLHQKLMAGK